MSVWSSCSDARGCEPRIYLSFYGLKENPFNASPDPRFLYMSPAHREALAQLVCATRERKGYRPVSGTPVSLRRSRSLPLSAGPTSPTRIRTFRAVGGPSAHQASAAHPGRDQSGGLCARHHGSPRARLRCRGATRAGDHRYAPPAFAPLSLGTRAFGRVLRGRDPRGIEHGAVLEE